MIPVRWYYLGWVLLGIVFVGAGASLGSVVGALSGVAMVVAGIFMYQRQVASERR